MSDRYDEFLAMHVPGRPLLLPNAWDIGSAQLLQRLGFAAVATTSGGFAATLGLPDGGLTRDQALTHAAALASALTVPVNADLEHGFADDPDAAADTYALAAAAGVAGASIEDYDPVTGAIYPIEFAAARVRAAVAAAHAGPERLVLVARAENHIRGVTDLDDTIARLRAYQDAGADVLYAPGVQAEDDLAGLVDAVDRPVNVLALPEFRRCLGWRSSASPGCRSAAGSHWWPAAPWSRPPRNYSPTAPTASGRRPLGAGESATGAAGC